MLIADVAFANSAGENHQALPKAVQTDPSDSQKYKLLWAEISMPKNGNDEESRNRLKWMIEQVRSVEFESEVQAIETPVVQGEIPVFEPNEALPEASPEKIEKVQEIKIEVPYEQVSDRTLKRLKNLLLRPDQLNDPLELGEILFSSDRTEDAVLLYEEALKRMDPNDVSLSGDRVWVLFQLGNCLRNHEPASAMEIYRRVLVEYPDSPWTDLAKARREIIEWHLEEKLHDWMNEPKGIRR